MRLTIRQLRHIISGVLAETISPRIEDHTDDGIIEANIIAAWRRLSAGMDVAQCHDELLAKGVSVNDAHYAIQAALILLDEPVTEAANPVKAPKIVLGGVYYNPRHHEIGIHFIDGDQVAYDLVSGGKVKSFIDVRASDLEKLMIQQGFKLDHVESW